jgi:hypothetical protein
MTKDYSKYAKLMGRSARQQVLREASKIGGKKFENKIKKELSTIHYGIS